MSISQREKSAALLVTCLVAASLATAQWDATVVHGAVASAWFVQVVDLLVTVLHRDAE